jgi:type VII secretion-associated serine protease mycosin
VKLGKIPAAATAFLVTAAAVLFGGPAEADRIRNDEWHIRSLNVADANKISAGRGVIVAVVDTGVYPHVDLRDNLLSGTSMLPGAGDNGKSDPNGHGTKMASLIAAHGRPNQMGVVGIAPEAKILPVRDSDAEGKGSSSTAAKAIEWAANHGAKVINFSRAVGPSFDLQTAIKVAGEKDALVVAASGNVGQDVVAAYPAAMPGVLAVGASDQSGQHAAVSVPTKQVQICAPGVKIEGAKPPNRYSIGEGTSDSTAIVSGAAALVRSKFPQLSAQEVIHRLTATATDIGKPGRDDECGYGVLNIVKALTADVPPPANTAAPSAGATTPPSQAPSTPTAADSEPASSNTPAVVGGVVIVLLVGGLVAFLVTRRRRKTS